MPSLYAHGFKKKKKKKKKEQKKKKKKKKEGAKKKKRKKKQTINKHWNKTKQREKILMSRLLANFIKYV